MWDGEANYAQLLYNLDLCWRLTKSKDICNCEHASNERNEKEIWSFNRIREASHIWSNGDCFQLIRRPMFMGHIRDICASYSEKVKSFWKHSSSLQPKQEKILDSIFSISARWSIHFSGNHAIASDELVMRQLHIQS